MTAGRVVPPVCDADYGDAILGVLGVSFLLPVLRLLDLRNDVLSNGCVITGPEGFGEGEPEHLVTNRERDLIVASASQQPTAGCVRESR